MLIKHRLATFQELVSTFNLSVSVTYVRSEMNRADALTRVKKSWLRCGEAVEETTCNVAVHDMHADHHFGVERTLYLARMVNQDVTRKEVEKVY